MPYFPLIGVAPRKSAANFTMSFLAAGGDTSSSQLADIPSSITPAELAIVAEDLSALTNAALIKTSLAATTAVSRALVNPLDEAYASASTKLILVFQDEDLAIQNISVPAPDESLFGPDGITILTPNGAAAAGSPAKLLADAIASVGLAMNGGLLGAGTFIFLMGYRSERTRKLDKPRIVRASIEPGAGVFPPALPGN